MGNRIAKDHIERPTHERNRTGSPSRLFARHGSRRSRRVMRGVACWLALQTALNMPLEERRLRHEKLLAATREHDIHNWYCRFFQDLTGESLRKPAVARTPRDPDEEARQSKRLYLS